MKNLVKTVALYERLSRGDENYGRNWMNYMIWQKNKTLNKIESFEKVGQRYNNLK